MKPKLLDVDDILIRNFWEWSSPGDTMYSSDEVYLKYSDLYLNLVKQFPHGGENLCIRYDGFYYK